MPHRVTTRRPRGSLQSEYLPNGSYSNRHSSVSVCKLVKINWRCNHIVPVHRHMLCIIPIITLRIMYTKLKILYDTIYFRLMQLPSAIPTGRDRDSSSSDHPIALASNSSGSHSPTLLRSSSSSSNLSSMESGRLIRGLPVSNGRRLVLLSRLQHHCRERQLKILQPQILFKKRCRPLTPSPVPPQDTPIRKELGENKINCPDTPTISIQVPVKKGWPTKNASLMLKAPPNPINQSLSPIIEQAIHHKGASRPTNPSPSQKLQPQIKKSLSKCNWVDGPKLQRIRSTSYHPIK